MNDALVRQIHREATTWCEKHAVGTPVAWEWEMKFAELIVEECLQQIGSIMDYTSYDTYELQKAELDAMKDARAVIKERFGLK